MAGVNQTSTQLQNPPSVRVPPKGDGAPDGSCLLRLPRLRSNKHSVDRPHRRQTGRSLPEGRASVHKGLVPKGLVYMGHLRRAPFPTLGRTLPCLTLSGLMPVDTACKVTRIESGEQTSARRATLRRQRPQGGTQHTHCVGLTWWRKRGTFSAGLCSVAAGVVETAAPPQGR